MGRTLTIVLLALAIVAASARAQTSLPAVLDGVGFDQRLDEQVPLELTFRDEANQPVSLGTYFDGRPVILVLAYYRCPMLCDQVLNGLTQAMLDMPFDAGKEYRVLTVSFDPREKPELAAAKRRNYLERYGRPGGEEGWHFLTGNEPEIARLAEAVGFRYKYDPVHDQFNHASGIVVLTPAGKVSRYFYDVRFSPRDLRLGLVEASQGQIGSPIDQVLLYCFHYDPTLGKYGPTILNLVRLGGVLTMIAVGLLFFVLWRRERMATNPAVPTMPAR